MGYDSFEFSFENTAGDAANLTSIDSFAIPMRMWVPGNTTSNNRSGFQQLPSNQNWVKAIGDLVPKAGNILTDVDGNFLMVATPTSSTFKNNSFLWEDLPQVKSTSFAIGANYQFNPGQPIQFSQQPNGALSVQLPSPLKFDTVYYVLTYDNGTGIIELSEALNNSAIEFTAPSYQFNKVNPSTGTITIAPNLNYLPNQEVSFSGSGTLPGGLEPETTYYVFNYINTTGELQVSTTSSGSLLTFKSSGNNINQLFVTNQTIAGSNPGGLGVSVATPEYPQNVYPGFDTYVEDFASWLPLLNFVNKSKSLSEPVPILNFWVFQWCAQCWHK